MSVTGRARSIGESMLPWNRLSSQGFRPGLRTAAAPRLKTLICAAVGRLFFAPDGAFVLRPGRKPWAFSLRSPSLTGYSRKK
jgi:hypothetical protein